MRGIIAALALGLLFEAGVAQAQGLPFIGTFLGTPDTQTAYAAPSSVDLLFEADSYVPPFYRGRPLPSAGASMHFQAIAHFFSSTGVRIPDNQIVYTWRRDGIVEGSISGLGKSTAIMASPMLFGTDTISVDARSTDLSAYGSASITLESVDPGVTLYRNHPLFGMEYHDALGDETRIPDLEMTFAAVPYFSAARGADDPFLFYSWSVDGTPAPTNSNTNEITINADKSSGRATISLGLTSPNNPFLSARNSWNLSFSLNNYGTQTTTR